MDCVHHIVSAVWEENSNLSDDSDKTGSLALLAAWPRVAQSPRWPGSV